MTAKPSRLIKMRDGSAANAALIAALRMVTMRAECSGYDITDLEHAEQARVIQASSGIGRMTITVAAVLRDEGFGTTLMQRCLSGTAQSYRFEYQGTSVLTGSFLLTVCEIVGEVEQFQMYRMTLESTGPVAFSVL